MLFFNGVNFKAPIPRLSSFVNGGGGVTCTCVFVCTFKRDVVVNAGVNVVNAGVNVVNVVNVVNADLSPFFSFSNKRLLLRNR